MLPLTARRTRHRAAAAPMPFAILAPCSFQKLFGRKPKVLAMQELRQLRQTNSVCEYADRFKYLVARILGPHVDLPTALKQLFSLSGLRPDREVLVLLSFDYGRAQVGFYPFAKLVSRAMGIEGSRPLFHRPRLSGFSCLTRRPGEQRVVEVTQVSPQLLRAGFRFLLSEPKDIRQRTAVLHNCMLARIVDGLYWST